MSAYEYALILSAHICILGWTKLVLWCVSVVPSYTPNGGRRDMKTAVHILSEKPLLAIILLFVCTLHVTSQEQRENAPQDSTAKKTQAFDALSLYPSPTLAPPLSLKTGLDGFDGFPSLPSMTMGSEYGVGFLRLSLASPMPAPWGSQQKFSLATCWTNEWRRQQEYRTFRMILGSIQAGGALYLAYRHMKKYGFK